MRASDATGEEPPKKKTGEITTYGEWRFDPDGLPEGDGSPGGETFGNPKLAQTPRLRTCP